MCDGGDADNVADVSACDAMRLSTYTVLYLFPKEI